MEYTVILNGQAYDLPKKTIQIWSELDKILKIDSSGLPLRERYKKMFEFIKSMVGADNVISAFGADNIDSIDLNDISLAIIKIRDAYDLPLRAYQLEQTSEAFNSLPADKIEALTKLAEATDKMKHTQQIVKPLLR